MTKEPIFGQNISFVKCVYRNLGHEVIVQNAQLYKLKTKFVLKGCKFTQVIILQLQQKSSSKFKTN